MSSSFLSVSASHSRYFAYAHPQRSCPEQSSIYSLFALQIFLRFPSTSRCTTAKAYPARGRGCWVFRCLLSLSLFSHSTIRRASRHASHRGLHEGFFNGVLYLKPQGTRATHPCARSELLLHLRLDNEYNESVANREKMISHVTR